jgi:hypothetical protein
MQENLKLNKIVLFVLVLILNLPLLLISRPSSYSTFTWNSPISFAFVTYKAVSTQ